MSVVSTLGTRDTKERRQLLELDSLLEQFYRAWQKHQPIAAWISGSSETAGAEDLTDAGQEQWAAELESMQSEANRLVQSLSSDGARAVASEVRRALAERLYQCTVQQTYKCQLRPYIMLISTGLLPFALTNLEVWEREQLRARIDAALGWLATAERHHQQEALFVSSSDATQAIQLSKAIADWLGPLITKDNRLSQSVHQLIEATSRWGTRASARPGMKATLTADSLDFLLSDALGTGKGLEWWQHTLSERLTEELDQFGAAESAAATTLQEMELERSWAWPFHIMEENALKTAHSTFDWLSVAHEQLMQNCQGVFFTYDVNNVALRAAPDVAAPLLTEMLYVPTVTSKMSGYLLVAPSLLNAGIPPSLRYRLHSLANLAHELCPGHHEQLARRKNGVLGDYVDVLRSPLGLEGWAFYGERVIIDMGGKQAAITHHYHVIRRLLPVAVTLTRLRNGRASVVKLLEHVVTSAPSLVQEANRNGGLGAAGLSYVVGLVETEAALRDLYRDGAPNQESRAKLTEAYLAQGPISPRAAVTLARVRACPDSQDDGSVSE